MAGAFVSLVLDADRGDLDPSATLVLVVLANHANIKQGGHAWPSNATISRQAGIGERQVSSHKQTLVARGLISCVEHGRGGRGQATTFKLEIEALLRSMAPEKAAAHCKELRKIPGSLPHGFTLRMAMGNPAAGDGKPSGPAHKGSGPASETQQPAATELEVELEVITGKGTGNARTPARQANGGAATIGQLVTPLIKRLKGKPEGSAQRSGAEQVAHAEASIGRPLAADDLNAWKAKG